MSTIELQINKKNAERFDLSFVWSNCSHFENTLEQLVAREMLSIQKAAETNCIPILFFKGLVEKRDTYDTYAIRRTQHDVDMLVSVENIYEFCEVCRSMGFCKDLENGRIDHNWISDTIASLNGHHLPMLYKKLLGGSFIIGLEVHIMVDSLWKIEKNTILHSQDMLARRCLLNSDFPIYVFDIYDRLIVSMHHFSKHFLENFLTYYYCPRNQLFACKSLLDAYLIIKKYGNTLFYGTFLSRARCYGFVEYVRFAAKMITQLFKLNRQETDFFTNMLNEPYLNNRNSSKTFFANQTLYCASKALHNIVAKTNLAFYKEAVYECLCKNKSIAIRYDEDVNLPLETAIASQAFKSTVSVYWNSDVIKFSIILNKSLSNKRNGMRQDGISIRVYNPAFDFENDNAVRNIFVCFEKTSNGFVPNISFNGSDSFGIGKIRLPDQYVSFDDNISILIVSIPWKELSILISDISYIGLEFMVCHDLEDMDTQINYFSNIVWPHYNPAKFGMVRLIKEK